MNDFTKEELQALAILVDEHIEVLDNIIEDTFDIAPLVQEDINKLDKILDKLELMITNC